jgi:hypothetical protein
VNDEPLYCILCGAEDWECGHVPGDYGDAHAVTDDLVDHGPEAFCEVSCCHLWRGERCEYCACLPGGEVTRG